MSVVDMIACGMIEIRNSDTATYKLMRREVRKELRAARIRMTQAGSRDWYSLASNGKRSGHRLRTFLGRGSLVECCQIIVRRTEPITPSDHEDA